MQINATALNVCVWQSVDAVFFFICDLQSTFCELSISSLHQALHPVSLHDQVYKWSFLSAPYSDICSSSADIVALGQAVCHGFVILFQVCRALTSVSTMYTLRKTSALSFWKVKTLNMRPSLCLGGLADTVRSKWQHILKLAFTLNIRKCLHILFNCQSLRTVSFHAIIINKIEFCNYYESISLFLRQLCQCAAGIAFLRGFLVSLQNLGGTQIACQLFLLHNNMSFSAVHAQRVK